MKDLIKVYDYNFRAYPEKPRQEEMFEVKQLREAKTYRAIRHDVIRAKQAQNSNDCHHPDIKLNQIKNILSGQEDLKILELFAGRGNLTAEYKKYGKVEAYDRSWLKTGDSYLVYHKLISEKKKYDVIDLDPYGFPSRFFPDIYLLIEDGYLFVTCPKPFINILNDITKTHMVAYFGKPCPELDDVQEAMVYYGLCHWREVFFEDTIDMGRLWRLAIRVKKVKATDYTGVRNR
jgi:hypothetical protein